jgi:hypothetical protein
VNVIELLFGMICCLAPFWLFGLVTSRALGGACKSVFKN